jgi:catechol 2,3-dioxygenase-like lactoylglutathione lyase family enzyme
MTHPTVCFDLVVLGTPNHYANNSPVPESRMPLTRIEHYLVISHDIDATRDFYRDVMGFAEGYRPDLGFPGHWLYIGDTPCIHIAEWDTYTAHSNRLGLAVTTRAPGTGPVDHVAFSGADYDAVLARIEAANLPVERHSTPAIGLRQLFVKDPNGVKLEINFFPPH